MTGTEVIQFWFNELKPAQWFKKDLAVDQEIRDRFLKVHAQAARCELYAWRTTPHGRLAEILVLDQFSRNIYRDQDKAFACDALALALAQEAVSLKVDQQLKDPKEKAFLYMPFMHSESLEIHKLAVQIFSSPGLEDNLKFELLHKSIIDRFGRYPHRNQILGRSSTPEELEFLKTPGSSF